MATIQTDNLAEYILVEHRWLIVIVALLPISLVWKIWSTFRNWLVFKLNSAPRMHDKKVKDVQRQIKSWLAGDRSTRLCTARPTWQTMSFRHGLYKKTFTNISVNLVDVLEVDSKNMFLLLTLKLLNDLSAAVFYGTFKKRAYHFLKRRQRVVDSSMRAKTVRCEPLVTMGQLSRTLEPLGLALAVVPELDKLTIGGLVMGTGVETSSHIHGLFQHICLQYELVMADGSVVTCSKDESADLFYAVPWSYGTLGFLTSVIIKVIPAKKYIRLQYEACTSLSELTAKFTKESLAKEPHQFVESLVFTKDTGVVMTGDMVDEIGTDGKLNSIGRWYSEWFYKQVERHLRRYQEGDTRPIVEYIPIRDYYHRHTKSLFWELQDIVPFGNNVIFRVLFGWLMPPEVSLLKLTQSEAVTKLYEKAHVIQDMLVPIDSLEKAVLKFHEEFEVYPMWLCPFKVWNQPGQIKIKSGEWKMFVDIGVYGVPKAKGYETVASTRRIENFVIQNEGFQMLYADTYVTLEEFRQMFDHTLYDKVRDTLPFCKEAFPEIYGKVNRSVRK